MVSNRVAQDAPMCVAVLRDKVQPLAGSFLRQQRKKEAEEAKRKAELKSEKRRRRTARQKESADGESRSEGLSSVLQSAACQDDDLWHKSATTSQKDSPALACKLPVENGWSNIDEGVLCSFVYV